MGYSLVEVLPVGQTRNRNDNCIDLLKADTGTGIAMPFCYMLDFPTTNMIFYVDDQNPAGF